MPLVQSYRVCICVKECYDAFYEDYSYYYFPLVNKLVGVLDANEEKLYIMTEELFWQNFTDPKRETRRLRKLNNQ